MIYEAINLIIMNGNKHLIKLIIPWKRVTLDNSFSKIISLIVKLKPLCIMNLLSKLLGEH
jgi:hypothetical protein